MSVLGLSCLITSVVACLIYLLGGLVLCYMFTVLVALFIVGLVGTSVPPGTLVPRGTSDAGAEPVPVWLFW
jgi:hypothetical protein